MHVLDAGYDIRPLSNQDAQALTDAHQRNREHLAPWSPRRDESFFSLPGQQAELERHLADIEAGRMASFVLVRESRIVGRINMQTIVRGAFHSATLGYWVDQDEQGRGLATAAVRFACAHGLEIGLHRLEASTLVHNEPSQQVLRKCGFSHFGTAPEYLWIDGEWQDHHLYQRILHHHAPRPG